MMRNPKDYTRESKSETRDGILKVVRKGKGAGRPMQPIKHSSRAKLNQERDCKLRMVLKDLEDMKEKI